MQKNAVLDVALKFYYILLFLIYIPTNGDGQYLIPRPQGYYIAMILPFLFLVILLFNKKILYYKQIIEAFTILFVLFLFCALSSFWSPLSIQSFWRSLQTFLPILILGVLILNVTDSYRFLISICKINVFYSMILTFFAIVIKTLGDTYWLVNEISINHINVLGFTINQYLYKFDDYFRYSSITGNPNLFGWITFLGLASVIILLRSKKLKRWQFIIIFLLQIYSLYLCRSRTDILVTILFVLLFYITKSKYSVMSKKNLYKMIFTLSSITVIIAIFLLFNYEKISSISLSGRNYIWGLLLRQFESHPLFGIGFNTTQELLLAYGVDDSKISGGAHSFYIGFLTETGLIGMLVFIIFAIYCLSLFFKNKTKSNLDQNEIFISTLTACLLVSLLIHQITEFLLLRNNYFNYVWFILLFAGLKLHFDTNKRSIGVSGRYI